MHDVENIEFQDQVGNWILETINRGYVNFNDILINLPGVYPTIVLNSLKILAAQGKIPECIYHDSINVTCKKQEIECQKQSFSSVPHPLDYDWRFSDSASDRLIAECSALATDSEPVAFLGTPTVFYRAKNTVSRQLILIDINSEISLTHFDNPSNRRYKLNTIKDSLPKIDVSMVILDPPWYEGHFRAFLWVAREICRVGGYLFVSMPPLGTRPNIERDNRNVITWASQIGLRLLKYEEQVLPYMMPLFERNALKVNGIISLPIDWRRGDLAVFRCEDKSIVERPTSSCDEEAWHEVSLEGVRIKVRHKDFVGFRDPSLVSLIEGDIFPSVSNRDSRRALVDVWTSGNRIYKCKDTNTFIEILEALRLNMLPDEIANISNQHGSKEIIFNTIKQINAIIDMEKKEIELYEGVSGN